ncbi:MAG: MATE family efflux transporter [Coprococcus sp.]
MKISKERQLFDNRALVALIIPLIIEQFLAVLVGMADSIMVASVGEAAVSGVSLVDNIVVLLINIFSALATGGAVVAGQYLGRKREEEACKSAGQLVWFVTISAVGVTAIVYLCKSFILHGVFGKIEADVMEHANTYLLIVTASIPFIALYNGGAAIFRAMGDSKIPMIVSMIMNVINVSGNAILIYGFHCGTEGVAIPTLVSRAVAAILITILLCNSKRVLHLEKTFRYRFDGAMVKNILKIGVPNGLENSMFQSWRFVWSTRPLCFGAPSAIAANAVSNAVAMFQILPGISINLAIITVISRCVGARDYEQVKYYTRKLHIITYAWMIVENIIIALLIPTILKVYHLSDLTAQTTEQILLFHAVAVVTIWPLSFSLPCTLRAAGDVQYTMYMSIFSMWIFRIAFSYVLGKYMGLGVFGIWVAMVIDWIFRAICFVIRYLGGKWKHKATV